MALDNMGLTALDPRVAAVEKFIQDKQVPSQQVPEFLMSMGADPRLARPASYIYCRAGRAERRDAESYG
jgi:hypothetical protein